MKKTKPRRLCGWVPEDIDKFDMPIICGKINISKPLKTPRKIYNYVKYLLIVLVLALGTFTVFRLLITKTYYGYVDKISTSGEARFRWYDTKTNKIKNPDDQYAWFWVMPVNVPEDTALTDKWIKFINDNIDSVFKITGTRGKDDCDYYGPNHCVENIDVKTIEVVGTNKLMKF